MVKVGKSSIKIGKSWCKVVKMLLVDVSSIRNGGKRTFWAQRRHLKIDEIYTFYCLLIVESHKVV